MLNTTMTFEQLYIEAREKEQRIYSDAELAELPDIRLAHIHYTEWQLRKKSMERLVRYLKQKQQPLRILEVGCGNGWLSSKLANIKEATVLGIDVNATELWQGAKVFNDKPNLSFEYGDIRDRKFERRQFDIVVFAASLQYFPELPNVLDRALSLLTITGEVHIIDTAMYDDEEAVKAHVRTKDYYVRMGYPELSDYYFHHTWHSLRHFEYRVLYKPTWFAKRILNKGPFPWLLVSPHI